MPSPQAKPLHVSPLQHELLQRMVHRTTSAQRLVKRGHIILVLVCGAKCSSPTTSGLSPLEAISKRAYEAASGAAQNS